jgi:UDP-2,3-diacylglucosamine hydrolase
MEPAQAAFVSDAHLADPEGPPYRRMLAFLHALGEQPDFSDLFVLGDFFEFWMGFKRTPAPYRAVVEALAALVQGGARLHYVEGNHDIDVAPYFARHLGAEVHPERAEAVLGDRRLLLMHGDTVDRSDRGYRFLRRALRSFPLKPLARALAPETVLRLSGPFTGHAPYAVSANTALPGLLREAARAAWGEGYDGVVMGHCHVPELLEEPLDGRPRFYANLGDWLTHFTYLAWDGKGFELRRFGPEEAPAP